MNSCAHVRLVELALKLFCREPTFSWNIVQLYLALISFNPRDIFLFKLAKEKEQIQRNCRRFKTMTLNKWPFCPNHKTPIESVDRSLFDWIVNILKTTIGRFSESPEMFFWQTLERFLKVNKFTQITVNAL